ncbi:efflux transporter, outer membrane factor (OMF) lipoprotein, NodT family [Acinetobacter marinus]|uniref:Efflux transporter, outer membrane factor (OMF) lipoprotein, NodT family n=1 Tax=Acinetobacter marinus TaxID=281375 RepID=A0A1G6HFF7_9GAMM|nr:efflux transporter outer membrane subunit [Acinetobacter marinus]SDB92848.1 efflux transporter, outer membrane factor (OMF) lipoprotein, NodT family [Acinetobacter marinus]
MLKTLPINALPKLSALMMVPILFAGCAASIKTPYHAPSVSVPSDFQYQRGNGLNANQWSDQWWTLFNDAQLNSLVDQVIAKNGDLAVAGIAVKQARLQADLTANQQGLRVGSNVSTGHNYDLNSGNDSADGLSLSGNVSYEVDLFGKLANQTEAQRWEALATEQDLQATAQTLIGTTCNLYWQLAYLNERMTAAEQSLATSNKLFDLVKAQYRAGAVSGIEMTEAEQSVQSQKATVSELRQQIVEARTALAVLLHQPVQQLNVNIPNALPHSTLPNIEAGLPAALISRRPDLQAAELRLRKTLATKDATKASYYPSISLTSSLGATSTSLTELLQNPVLALGASLSLPFLQYNDMKKDIAISELDYESAIISYRQTLYQAFADVENALSGRIEINEQVADQQKNLELAQKSARLNEVRYRHGAVALKNVLDAQESVRSAQVSLAQTRYNQYTAYVTLMQALGGSPIQKFP